ncbi:uncharacterized protein LOC114713451 isoform X2 [Neltuma alba]|uniref:uncharacterized protein LOC114713451 isoform X2 n=1 Tax=Neltuma alba TaxID=207710 RepID=UPI0010A348D3|nr:uncharacterized protein LOC114713451 isoform X2 [Prosopis alba]
MASAESNHVDHVVELMERDPSASPGDAEAVSEQTTPLLIQAEVPKINIFTASYPRRKPRDEVTRSLESETSSMTQFILWVWSGSRYSGLLCMTLTSTIYFLMEVLSNIFSVQAIPLFETAFTRCTIILILSYLWLRRSEQPLFGTSQVRTILFSRALIGYMSLSSFVYCIQRLPFSQAVVLNLTTPVLTSIMARVFWHEKLTIAEMAGHLIKAEEGNNANSNRTSHIFAILLGLFSAITGGISYCLIRAGAKASNEPLLTIFSFGLLASPVTGICMFIFEDFVLPGFPSILLMLVLGVLAFFAEVMLARGLQLERTCKAANVLYLEAALSQVWRILALSKVAASFGQLVGCFLIVFSFCCTMYIGPDKEDME